MSYWFSFTYFAYSHMTIYSQTCLNNHLYKTITHLRRPMLSLPKQILNNCYSIRQPPV